MVKKKLLINSKKVDQFLIKFLKRQKSLLVEPMKYCVISGGKKIRSTIIYDTGKIFNVEEKKTIKYLCSSSEHSFLLSNT